MIAADLRKLTKRERQVFEGIGHGTPHKAIAMQLGCATKTVSRHACNLYRKVGGAFEIIQFCTLRDAAGGGPANVAGN